MDSDDEKENGPPSKRHKSKKEIDDGRTGVLRSSNSICDSGPPNPAKSTTAARAPTKKKARKIVGPMRLNYDIFLQIAFHSTPDVLLALSRTCQSLRSLLTEDYPSTWARADWLAGLPSCPADLKPPQYASLIFDKKCKAKGCNRISDRRPIWAASHVHKRTRVCAACFTKRTMSFPDMIANFTKDEGEISSDDLAKMIWWECRAEDRHPFYIRQQEFYVPALEKILEEYFDTAQAERSTFIEQRKIIAREKDMHRAAIENWYRVKEDMRKAHLADIRRRRREKIIGMLAATGHSAELLSTEYDKPEWKKEWSRLVSKTQLLTDEIWKGLRPKLEQIINLRRQKQIRQETILSWGSSLVAILGRNDPYLSCFNAHDLLGMQPAIHAIDDVALGANVPLEVFEGNETRTGLRQLLRGASTPRWEWIEAVLATSVTNVYRELGSLQNSASHDAQDLSTLRLATTFFERTRTEGSIVLLTNDTNREWVFDVGTYTASTLGIMIANELQHRLQSELSLSAVFRCWTCHQSDMTWAQFVQHQYDVAWVYEHITPQGVHDQTKAMLMEDVQPGRRLLAHFDYWILTLLGNAPNETWFTAVKNSQSDVWVRPE
ncbi:hypothetical protein DFH11DRAFT_1620968 [Phellopilus nigrolimitatus]|nr:hypothetical protein DFH11DRAFT_1620968 [Phellopilus nigrolimitatus]